MHKTEFTHNTTMHTQTVINTSLGPVMHREIGYASVLNNGVNILVDKMHTMLCI